MVASEGLTGEGIVKAEFAVVDSQLQAEHANPANGALTSVSNEANGILPS